MPIVFKQWKAAAASGCWPILRWPLGSVGGTLGDDRWGEGGPYIYETLKIIDNTTKVLQRWKWDKRQRRWIVSKTCRWDYIRELEQRWDYARELIREAKAKRQREAKARRQAEEKAIKDHVKLHMKDILQYVAEPLSRGVRHLMWLTTFVT